jgi:mannose/fructose/N-acetylgalactosamine-specific phosphotransferase system component IIB
MPLSLVRIDDRLVHGQVVEGWIPHLRAELVLVVCDTAAADELQVSLMRLALPDNVDLEALPVREAARHPAFGGAYPKRVLVLAPGPLEILRLLEAGVPLKTVNVGGLHYTAGKVQLGKAIFLSEEDRKALRQILKRGVNLEGRAVPTEPALDLVEMLDSHEGHA